MGKMKEKRYVPLTLTLKINKKITYNPPAARRNSSAIRIKIDRKLTESGRNPAK
jgi:hypothetical protein